MAKSKFNAIIVGGGLAGLMAAIKIAEAGADVSLFSLVDAKRSHSVCAQGGVNAAVNTKGEGDSPWIHFQETIYGGDFLANPLAGGDLPIITEREIIIGHPSGVMDLKVDARFEKDDPRIVS